jgi:hypothetical protein
VFCIREFIYFGGQRAFIASPNCVASSLKDPNGANGVWSQGDQIGRFFAYWVVVYFGCCFLNTEAVQIRGLLFSNVSVVFIF